MSSTSSGSLPTPDAFASEWDFALADHGPPTIFTLDPSGRLRADPERTREIYLLSPSLLGREHGHFVLTDERTGLRLYLYVTHRDLALRQPRGAVQAFPDGASAAAEAVAQWTVPAPEPAVD